MQHTPEPRPNISSVLKVGFTHPQKASSRMTEQQITRSLENLAMELDGIKNIHSTTFPGTGILQLEFHRKSHLSMAEAKLIRRIRLYRKLFPAGFQLPEYEHQKRDDRARIKLTGSFVTSGELRKSLDFWLQQHGLKTDWSYVKNQIATPQADPYYQSLIQYGTTINPSESIRIDKEKIQRKNRYTSWLYQDIARDETAVWDRLHLNQAPLWIENNRPTVALTIFSTNATIERIIKRWPAYATYQSQIKFPVSKRLFEQPLWVGYIILLVFWNTLRYIFFHNRGAFSKLCCQLLCSGLLVLFLLQFPQENKVQQLVLAIIPCLPLIIRNGIRRQLNNISLLRWIVVLLLLSLCVTYLTKALGEQSLQVSADVWAASSPNALTATIQLKNPTKQKQLRTYITTIRTHISQRAETWSMEQINPYCYRLTILSNRSDRGAIRKELIHRALNSSGTYWFIQDERYGNFSTFPEPLYPSVQWALANSDLNVLLQSIDRLIDTLKHQPFVNDVQPVGTNDPFDLFTQKQYSHEKPIHDLENAFQQQGIDDFTVETGLFEENGRFMRGNEVFSNTLLDLRVIKKYNRKYYATVGHEYDGPRGSEKRFRKRITSYIKQFPAALQVSTTNNISAVELMEIGAIAFLWGMIFIAVLSNSMRTAMFGGFVCVTMFAAVAALHACAKWPLPAATNTYFILSLGLFSYLVVFSSPYRREMLFYLIALPLLIYFIQPVAAITHVVGAILGARLIPLAQKST